MIAESHARADQPLTKDYRQFLRNFFGYGYTQFITLAAQFGTVPLFLHYWGTRPYADWLILSGLPTFFSALDFGVGQASTSKATMLAAKGDIEGSQRSLHTSFAFSLMVSGALMLGAILLVQVVDPRRALNIASVSSSDTRISLVLLTAYVCVVLVGNGPVNGWFRSAGRTATGIFLLANRRAVDVIVTVLVILMSGRFVMLAAALFISQLISFLLIMAYAKIVCFPGTVGIKRYSLSDLRTVLKPALGHVAITFGQVITLQGSVQILNQVSPGAAVVLYSMTRTLMRTVLQLGLMSSHSLRAELSRLSGHLDRAKADALMRKVTFRSLGVCTAFFLSLMFAAPWIIGIWSGGKVTTTVVIAALIGSHALVNSYWYVAAARLLATNSHAKLGLIYFICSALAITAFYLYTPKHAIVGAAMSMLLPELIAFLYTRIKGRQ